MIITNTFCVNRKSVSQEGTHGIVDTDNVCMTNNALLVYKSVGRSTGSVMEEKEKQTVEIEDSSDVFEFLKDGLGLVHECYSFGHDLPLYGRLIKVNDLFIAIQKRDGRVVTLRKSEIRSIAPTYNQPPREQQPCPPSTSSIGKRATKSSGHSGPGILLSVARDRTRKVRASIATPGIATTTG